MEAINGVTEIERTAEIAMRTVIYCQGELIGKELSYGDLEKIAKAASAQFGISVHVAKFLADIN